MRTAVALALLAAAAVAAALAALALQRGDERPEPPPSPPPAATETEPAPAPPPRMRAYESAFTLAEDLRDVLHDREALPREWARVSSRMRDVAPRVLSGVAREERGPVLRALLVLAAGVHAPDEPELVWFLADREPLVRRAAVLAAGAKEGGSRRAEVAGVEIALGRKPAPASEALLRELHRADADADVKEAVVAVCEAAGLSRPS